MIGVGDARRSAATLGADDGVGGVLEACAQGGELLLQVEYLRGHGLVAGAVLCAQCGQAALGVGEGLELFLVVLYQRLCLRRVQLRRVGDDASVAEAEGESVAGSGNGGVGRETEQMTVELIHRVGGGLSYMIVSEAGASVYSASKLAAEEFPQFDVNLRSAVSIARRLQDPLAELVKIDPKAIGVGQYQHDMPQKELDASLNAVVEDCVNAVGVDLNTASPSLLTRVAGLNGSIAKNIVAFREENGVKVLMDDFKVYYEKTAVGLPNVLRHLFYTGTSFRPRWNKVEGATKYYVNVYKSDEELNPLLT